MCCLDLSGARPHTPSLHTSMYRYFVLFVVLFVGLFLTLALFSKTSVGVRGHTAGRILCQLETKQKYGTYTPCESKLPPSGWSCVSLVLNQDRLHTTRNQIKKGIEKATEPAPTRRGTTATSLKGFPHPPTMPEGPVSASRRPGTHPSTPHPSLEKIPGGGCSVEGLGGVKLK